MNNKGFTLLELIVVLVIVGVLAGLALPRLFTAVEVSRSAEAFTNGATIRGAMERCLLRRGRLDSCYMYNPSSNTLDIDYPGDNPGAHFYYESFGVGDEFIVRAIRNSLDGGDKYLGDVLVILTIGGNVSNCGSGVYVSKSVPTCPVWP